MVIDYSDKQSLCCQLIYSPLLYHVLQGSAFRDQILTVMNSDSFFNSEMLSYNSTAEGSSIYTRFYHTVATLYPQYLDELRGMADGANISFSKVCIGVVVDQ